MRALITVYGLVQGVGFRPFIAGTCEKLNIDGYVRNIGGLVEIMVFLHEKNDKRLKNLLDIIKNQSPEGAIIRDCSLEFFDDNMLSSEGFSIVYSKDSQAEINYIPPDMAICESCSQEIFDKRNRRFRHPLISCTSCGPRFSIIKDLPYDRDKTIMDKFDMCPSCRDDYSRLDGRRRHAQTISCRECGPRLRALVRDKSLKEDKIILGDESLTKDKITKDKNLVEYKSLFSDDEIIDKAIKILSQGGVLAIKDLGGYHLCCRASDQEAVSRIKVYKNRSSKPSALMFRSISDIKKLCRVNPYEEEALKSSVRPIVLLDRLSSLDEKWSRDNLGYSDSDNSSKETFLGQELYGEALASSNRIGAMLASSPLQLLLSREFPCLLMTSANRGGESMIIDDEKAKELRACCDMIIGHDRDILAPFDDSILRYGKDGLNTIRRARGLVPEPVFYDRESEEEILALGGDLKATFALSRKKGAILSQYFGDLEDLGVKEAYRAEIERYIKLYGAKPKYLVSDEHEAYYSTRIGKELAQEMGIELIRVGHHYAHICSAIAENRLHGPLIGLALDGTGYGIDSQGRPGVYGGEIFVCDADKYGYERLSHIEEVKLLASNEASYDAKKSYFMYLINGEKKGLIEKEELKNLLDKDQMPSYEILSKAWDMDIGTCSSSSVGRLYDAVAYALGIGSYNTYEGECAIKLEACAQSYINRQKHECEKDENQLEAEILEMKLELDTLSLFSYIAKKKTSGKKVDYLAYLFHVELADFFVRESKRIAEDREIKQLVLGGGSFNNELLTRLIFSGLERESISLYINHKIPRSDQGLALGQLYAAERYIKENY